MQRRTLRRHLACLTTLAMGTAALALAPGLASAATQAPAGHTLAANTRFYVPPPAQGSVQQILQLVKSGQLKNAGLIAAMESVPSAVWLDGETAAQAAEPGNQGSAAGRRRRRPAGPAHPGRRPAGERGPDLRRLQHSRPRLLPVLGRRGANRRRLRCLDQRHRRRPRQRQGGGARGARRAGGPSRLLRRRVRGRVPRHHQHHPGRGRGLRGLDAGGGPEHQPLPRRREQRLAERRRHGRDAGRGGRPAVAGLLPQRLQLPVRHQQRLLRHLGVGVRRLRDRERGPDPGRRAGGVATFSGTSAPTGAFAGPAYPRPHRPAAAPPSTGTAAHPEPTSPRWPAPTPAWR